MLMIQSPVSDVNDLSRTLRRHTFLSAYFFISGDIFLLPVDFDDDSLAIYYQISITSPRVLNVILKAVCRAIVCNCFKSVNSPILNEIIHNIIICALLGFRMFSYDRLTTSQVFICDISLYLLYASIS